MIAAVRWLTLILIVFASASLVHAADSAGESDPVQSRSGAIRSPTRARASRSYGRALRRCRSEYPARSDFYAMAPIGGAWSTLGRSNG